MITAVRIVWTILKFAFGLMVITGMLVLGAIMTLFGNVIGFALWLLLAILLTQLWGVASKPQVIYVDRK